MVETALIVGAIASVAGTAYSVYSGFQAADAREDAAETRNRQIALQNRRRRRSQIRQSRIARAQAVNVAAQTGAQDSSGIRGGLSSLGSQTGSNLGYTSQQGALSALFGSYQQEASDWAGQAQIGQGVANIGTTLFNYGGGMPALSEGVSNWWNSSAPSTSPIPIRRPS